MRYLLTQSELEKAILEALTQYNTTNTYRLVNK